MKVRELAEILDAEVAGDAEVEILGVAPLHKAAGTDLSFLSNPKYREEARASGAGAILVSSRDHLPGRTLLLCGNPYVAFAKALAHFHPPGEPSPGIHPTAILGRECKVAQSASVGPYVVLGDGVEIGEKTSVGPECVVGDRVKVGEGCRLHPRVVLYDRTVLGDRVILHSGCVIGSDGFGYAQDGEEHLKVPQVGRVVVESDVEIGANSTVDRGTLEETRIGRGTKIDNLVQVAHNVVTGEGCILVAQSGISGSTTLGKHVILAGQSGAVGHITIGDGVRIGAKSAVTKDLPPGAFVTGHPAREHKLWLRERALTGRIEEMLKRIGALEARIKEEK